MLRTLSLLAALAPAAALCKGTASLIVSPCDAQLSKTGYQPNPTDPTNLEAPEWNCVADELERDVIVPMQLTVENGFQNENGNFSDEFNRYPYASAVIVENAKFVMYLACSGTSDRSCDQQEGVIDYTDVYINDAGTYQGDKPKTEVVGEESTLNAVIIRINTVIRIVEGVGDYTSAAISIGTVYGKAANYPDPDANQGFYRILIDQGTRNWPDFSSVARSTDANVQGDIDVCGQLLEAEAAGIAPLSFLVPQPSSPPSPSPSPSPSPLPSPPPSPSGPPSEEGEEGDEGEGNGGSDHDDDHDDDGDNDDGDNDDDDDYPR